MSEVYSRGALAAARSKLWWGWGHAENLEAKLAPFLRQPCPVDTQFDPKTREKRWIAGRPILPIPQDASLRFGDVLYNFRAAMDQLAALFVSAEARRSSAFPLCTDLKRWSGSRRAISQMPKFVQEEIEELQPYHRPDDEVPRHLGWLETLCNVDKHRHLHFVSVALHGAMYSRDPFAPQEEFFAHSGPFESGTVLAKVRPAEPDMQLNLMFDVALDEPAEPDLFFPTLLPLGYVIREIFSAVRAVFDDFEAKFLPPV